VLIRDVTDDDLDTLLSINEANTPAVGSVSAERLAFIVGDCEIALVADIDGQIAGFCLVLGEDSTYDSVNYRWFAERYEHFLYLDRVTVDERFRNRGVGAALYAEVDRQMASGSATHLALEVNVDPPNEGSLRFHAREGFVEVGRQDTPYGIRVSMLMRPVVR
jgi:hypothetical protein